MEWTWEGLVSAFDRLAPDGTPKRKLLQIISIILVIEGLSVLALFSYQGAAVGISSLALGMLLLVLLNPVRKPGRTEEAEVKPSDVRQAPQKDPPGIVLIKWVLRREISGYFLMALGAAAIVSVVVWNSFLSESPSYGDLDTLTIMFGGILIIFPLLFEKFEAEASFSLIFLGLVVLFLVVPQAVMSVYGGTGSSVGNAYVHYMLAAPFAGALDLIGIDASSQGNLVTMQFHDGTVQTLAISAYCVGLYSFSIFLAAFFSFVLVFERLPVKVLTIVLSVGLVIAYLGNLFRMVIIGIVGYYRGLDALLWAHENAGWIIFLSWSAVFWYLLLGYTSRHRSTD
ncbi:MAG: exosortase/archaeosortase family protein [Candidatus Thermoplasmatota archaeon]|nr:exosortase/archaeosortase family protein [Candidatus Thermoplasmatota archaeon]